MVFHPGHEELHGITVVVEGHDGETWVGRYDARVGDGIQMLHVAEHRASRDGTTRDEFLRELARTGPRPTLAHTTIPTSAIARIVRLGDLIRSLRGE